MVNLAWRTFVFAAAKVSNSQESPEETKFKKDESYFNKFYLNPRQYQMRDFSKHWIDKNSL